MILLDTNVVSEMMRAVPDPRVVAWLDAQVVETLHLSTVSLAELLLGVAVLPDGKRKAQLQGSLDGALQALFGERLLTFDAAAAQAYARLISRARMIGRPIGPMDGMIGAIAEAHRLIVASRDVAPFEAAGLTVISPWSAGRN